MRAVADASDATATLVHSVQAQGWSGIRNSDLLRRAEAEFELFITADQNIRYQQNLAGRRIAILELSTNDLRRIQAASALIGQQEKCRRVSLGS